MFANHKTCEPISYLPQVQLLLPALPANFACHRIYARDSTLDYDESVAFYLMHATKTERCIIINRIPT